MVTRARDGIFKPNTRLADYVLSLEDEDSGEEPRTFAKAEPNEFWRRAMLEEMKSIEENQTWTLTELPAGHKEIGLKWVFKVKRDAAGAVIKHKARIVAKGYV
jgi:hypothetical protein